VAPDYSARIGNLGAAQAATGLADVLEHASPDQVIVVVGLGDGADVVVLRTTAALEGVQEARRSAGLVDVAEAVDHGRRDLPYAVYLTWRGSLRREPPRRPDPERPDAPAMRRNEGWKFGFAASRCLACGFVHLPPTRVCLSCQSVDRMEPLRLADVRGTVATYTVDQLAFSLSPPMVGAVIDFDGGGRYRGEMTDMDPETVAIGTRVEMTFRRFYTAQGVHNYFWKARPIPDGIEAPDRVAPNGGSATGRPAEERG
jgi:hydroxymethylglutaryl-CoA synthase